MKFNLFILWINAAAFGMLALGFIVWPEHRSSYLIALVFNAVVNAITIRQLMARFKAG